MSSKEQEIFPPRFQELFGSPRVRRGTIDVDDPDQPARMLISWDAIPRCSGESCPITNICDYAQDRNCTVTYQYVKGVALIMFRNYKDELSEEQWLRVGLHLMPLYKALCRMKIYELGLGTVVNIDDKGSRKVNPIFKEIREQIKVISMEWKNLGLYDNYNPGKGRPPNPKLDPFIHGDRSYHATLEKKAKRLVERRAK
jgi:hypothetical protein